MKPSKAMLVSMENPKRLITIFLTPISKTNGINEAVNNTGSTTTDRDGFEQNSIQLGIVTAHPVLFTYNLTSVIQKQGRPGPRCLHWWAGLYLVTNQLAGRDAMNFLIGKAKLTALYSYNSINRLYTDDSTLSRNGFDTWSQGSYKGSEHFADLYTTLPIGKELKLTGASTTEGHNQTRSFHLPVSLDHIKLKTAGTAFDKARQVFMLHQTGIIRLTGFNTEAGARINFHSEYGSYAVYNINPSLFNK